MTKVTNYCAQSRGLTVQKVMAISSYYEPKHSGYNAYIVQAALKSLQVYKTGDKSLAMGERLFVRGLSFACLAEDKIATWNALQPILKEMEGVCFERIDSAITSLQYP